MHPTDYPVIDEAVECPERTRVRSIVSSAHAAQRRISCVCASRWPPTGRLRALRGPGALRGLVPGEREVRGAPSARVTRA